MNRPVGEVPRCPSRATSFDSACRTPSFPRPVGRGSASCSASGNGPVSRESPNCGSAPTAACRRRPGSWAAGGAPGVLAGQEGFGGGDASGGGAGGGGTGRTGVGGGAVG